jgi:phage baseplate assembly protein W
MGLGEFATGLPNGFGSPGQPVIRGKKFVLTDAQLVIQDFINALNIPLGSKVGQPDYGTTLWNFVFDPNTLDVQIAIENEVRRVASEDPRIDINIIKAFPQDLGILVEVQMSVVPFNNPSTVSLFLNQQTTQATLAGV